ncbi:MAG: hypothetical protein AB7P03_26700 [Kofleriaceae bacterium]
MGFDDLARHMASRDNKKLEGGTANEIVAKAAVAERRMNRTADLVLGLILLIGGLSFTIFTFVLASSGGGLSVIAYGAILVGAHRTFRGIRGRSEPS